MRAAAGHRPVRPRRPAAATGPAPAWRRFRLGRPPLPTRPAPASAPMPRFQLAAGPAARSEARIGRADALAHAPPTARPARRACPRRARRPHGVGLSGPPPAAGRSAHTAPRPPRAPHPQGAASASAARRYPRARPRLGPPRRPCRAPPTHGTQGRAPGDRPYVVPAPSTPLLHLRTGRSPLPRRGGVAAGSKGNRGPAGPRTGGPSIPPPIPPPYRTGAHALPPRRGREPGSHGQVVPLTATRAPSPPQTEGGTPPPPLGRCRHTPGQRDAGRLLPCALPQESVSGNFSRRHVLGATTTTTTTTYHTIPYHTIPYHTIPYHTIPDHTI